MLFRVIDNNNIKTFLSFPDQGDEDDILPQ